MSFFKTSTGSKIEAKASFDSNNSEPIPDNTTLPAIVTEAKWDSPPIGEPLIKLRWDVVDGQYKKRVVFQKIRVNEADPKKRDKALAMLAAIDFNCGGKLLAADKQPTDMDLMTNLTNKPMLIRVRIWETDDGNKGNWVSMVSSLSGAPAPQAAPAPAAQSFDDDIKF